MNCFVVFSYFVATLEAAIEHINSADFKLSSKVTSEMSVDDAVHEYFKVGY